MQLQVSSIEEMIQAVRELEVPIIDTPDLQSWSQERLSEALVNWCAVKRSSAAAAAQHPVSLRPSTSNEGYYYKSTVIGLFFVNFLI